MKHFNNLKHIIQPITILLLITNATLAQHIDYSQNGKNWNGTCSTGTNQSPINIDSTQTTQNSYVKFVVNYNAVDDQTLNDLDNGNIIRMNISDGSRNDDYTLDLWNERGEYQKYHLDYMQWKYKSEHTIDNRQYAAELQLYHKQYATNKQTVLSVLFDDELTLNGQKQKTCFVESWKFSDYVNRTGSLEIPVREYLQYIPQDFYYYYGSLTQPQCNETVTWLIFKAPQPITSAQLSQLQSLVKSPTGNYRNIQNVNNRTVYLSGAQIGYAVVISTTTSSGSQIMIDISRMWALALVIGFTQFMNYI